MISGPLVLVPTKTQTHRPGWARVQPAAGTQRAHSVAVCWPQVWGCREESLGFYGRVKAPPAVENAGLLLAGEEGARLRPPADPSPTSEMQNVPQLTEADGELWGLEGVVGRGLSQDQGPSEAGGL